mgnify:FL=1
MTNHEFPVTQYQELKKHGIKNGKRIFVGYNKDIKVKNKDINKSKRTTFFYVKQNFNNKNNELSESEVNKIICADSEEYLKTLPDNCIDLIFTSPPYNFGMEYETHDDSIVWNDYFKKMDAIITECVRVLKFGGRIAFNVQPLFSEYIPTHHIFSNMFMKHNLIWKAEIIWEKNNYNAKYTSWGSWKSPSSPYFKYTWEFVEVYCKGDLKKEGKSENSDITADEFKKWTVGKWSIAPERGMKLYNHPAMFPEELATRVIKMFSFINDVVLDPFNGAGTTTHIAHKLNRKYIGVDISKEYCKTAKRRITSKISDYYE